MLALKLVFLKAEGINGNYMVFHSNITAHMTILCPRVTGTYHSLDT